MADQKILLGNVRGEQGPAGPNTVSSSTTTSGFENGHLLYNNNGHVGAKSFLDLVYPVGSIFEWCNNGISGAPDLSSVDKVQKHFGGTWQEFGKGQVLAGFDSAQSEFNEAGKSGGSKTHRHNGGNLTATAFVKEDGTLVTVDGVHYDNSGEKKTWNAQRFVKGNNFHFGNEDIGSGIFVQGLTGDESTLPPYTTVFRYRRIA